jgi:hypothetical protein
MGCLALKTMVRFIVSAMLCMFSNQDDSTKKNCGHKISTNMCSVKVVILVVILV